MFVVTGTRLLYGVVEYERLVAVVGLRLRRIGLLMGSKCRVYGPVGCSAKFGVARSKFVLLMQCSVTPFIFLARRPRSCWERK